MRGGSRPGAGRPKGSCNKATAQARATLRERARECTGQALEALHDIAANGQSEAARVSAAVAILDRGYGRPTQTTELTSVDGGPTHHAWSDSELQGKTEEELSALYFEIVSSATNDG